MSEVMVMRKKDCRRTASFSYNEVKTSFEFQILLRWSLRLFSRTSFKWTSGYINSSLGFVSDFKMTIICFN